MNILVTSECNLRCSYCFAKHEMGSGASALSMEGYARIIAFLKRSNVHHLRLMGGEPTLARDFGRMLDIGIRDDHFRDITVFTNGLFEPEAVGMFKHEKVYLVVNCQEEKAYLEAERVRFERNMHALKREKVNFCLGVNICHEDYDTRYVLRLAGELGISLVRWGLASPMAPMSGDQQFVHYNQYGDISSMVFDFLMTVSSLGMSSQQDCCVPLCFFRNEQWERIADDDRILMRIGRCSPVLDVNANLEVFRCFALSGVSRLSLVEYENHDAIFDFYTREIDDRLMGVPRDEGCERCKFYLNRKCQGGCLAFKVKAPPELEARS